MTDVRTARCGYRATRDFSTFTRLSNTKTRGPCKLMRWLPNNCHKDSRSYGQQGTQAVQTNCDYVNLLLTWKQAHTTTPHPKKTFENGGLRVECSSLRYLPQKTNRTERQDTDLAVSQQQNSHTKGGDRLQLNTPRGVPKGSTTRSLIVLPLRLHY